MVKKSSELYIKCPDGEYAELPMVLQREIEIKDAYLELIYGLIFDYDGLNTVEGLKGLIDEVTIFVDRALNSDDKKPVYIDGDGNDLNILHEKIGGEKND